MLQTSLNKIIKPWITFDYHTTTTTQIKFVNSGQMMIYYLGRRTDPPCRLYNLWGGGFSQYVLHRKDEPNEPIKGPHLPLFRNPVRAI
jgi:hypothetical protein